MKHITYTTFQLLFSLALVVCLTVWFAPVVAAHTTVSGNGPNQAGYEFITHVVPTGDIYEDEDSVTIAPGTSANISESWTVTNSFSATVGISKDIVSAQLGYDVSASTSVSETCNTNVNTTNGDQLLEWQSQYVASSFDVYWHSNLTGQDIKEGTGWAKKYNQPRCAIYDTDTIE